MVIAVCRTVHLPLPADVADCHAIWQKTVPHGNPCRSHLKANEGLGPSAGHLPLPPKSREIQRMKWQGLFK
eukprot:581608-Amphidinium_carterae.1